MKRYLILLFIFSGLMLTILGCKKVIVTPVSSSVIEKEAIAGNSDAEWATGVLTGKIIFQSKYTLELYNVDFNFTTSDYYIDPGTGYFVFPKARVGGSILTIQSVDSKLPSKFVKVFIRIDEVSDLGLISIK